MATNKPTPASAVPAADLIEGSGETAAPASVESAPPVARTQTQTLVAAAKQSALVLLQDAHTATEKLLAIAAGDEKTQLTGAEAAAIPIILDTLPPLFRSIVAPFIQAAATKVEGPLNMAVDALVSTGLGLAHNWLEGVIVSSTHFLGRLEG